jgi:hypothetical protein
MQYCTIAPEVGYPIWHAQSITFGSIELRNPENIGFALETAFLVCDLIYEYFRFGSRHFGFTTSGAIVQHFFGFIELVNPENIVFAVDIAFLTVLRAEIWVLPFWRPPYWISHFRFGRRAFM